MKKLLDFFRDLFTVTMAIPRRIEHLFSHRSENSAVENDFRNYVNAASAMSRIQKDMAVRCAGCAYDGLCRPDRESCPWAELRHYIESTLF